MIGMGRGSGDGSTKAAVFSQRNASTCVATVILSQRLLRIQAQPPYLHSALDKPSHGTLPRPRPCEQVVAEKLNFFRYLSHFRSVHRGAYFAELRTTTVRKLLPESWGFMCPVHTPDGAPCGLLNHFTAACRIVTHGPHNREQTDAAIMQVRYGGQPCPCRGLPV